MAQDLTPSTGGVGYTAASNGYNGIGQALSLANADAAQTQYAFVSAPFQFGHAAGMSWTIEGFFNYTGPSSTGHAKMIISETTSSAVSFYLELSDPSRGVIFADVNGIGTQAGSIAGVIAASSGWHHFALVCYAGTSANVYIDGILRIAFTGGNYTPVATAFGYIGASSIGAAAYGWIGQLDAFLFSNYAKYSGGTLNGAAVFTIPAGTGYPFDTDVHAGTLPLAGALLYQFDGNLLDARLPSMTIQPQHVGDNTIGSALTIVGQNTAWGSLTSLVANLGTFFNQVVTTATQTIAGQYTVPLQSSTQLVQFTDNADAAIGLLSVLAIPQFNIVPNVLTVGVPQHVIFTATAHDVWTNSTVFTITGGSGAALSGYDYTNVSTGVIAATLDPGSVAAGAGLTITDPAGATVNVQVVTVSVSISPSVTSLAKNATQQFTATVSIGSPAVTWTASAGSFNNPSANPVIYQAPNTTGPVTITASTTGGALAQLTFMISAPQASDPPFITLVTSGRVDLITIPNAPRIGSYPIAFYDLWAGTTPGQEVNTGLSLVAPGTFPGQATAPPGTSKYYIVKTRDNQLPPNQSNPSNEVVSITSAKGYLDQITVTTPVLIIVSVNYGPLGSQTHTSTALGVTVYDTAWGLLVGHTLAGVTELPGSGQYTAVVVVDVTWSGNVVIDAPAGFASVPQPFGPNVLVDANGLLALQPGVVYKDLSTTVVPDGPYGATGVPAKNTVIGYLRSLRARIIGKAQANAQGGEDFYDLSGNDIVSSAGYNDTDPPTARTES